MSSAKQSEQHLPQSQRRGAYPVCGRKHTDRMSIARVPSDWDGVSAPPRPDYWALLNLLIVAFAAGFLVGMLA